MALRHWDEPAFYHHDKLLTVEYPSGAMQHRVCMPFSVHLSFLCELPRDFQIVALYIALIRISRLTDSALDGATHVVSLFMTTVL